MDEIKYKRDVLEEMMLQLEGSIKLAELVERFGERTGESVTKLWAKKVAEESEEVEVYKKEENGNLVNYIRPK